MQPLNLPTYLFNTKSENGRTYIFDLIRQKYIVLTPEEWVRQNFIHYLHQEKQFPKSLIGVETGLLLNKLRKRTDILLYDRTGIVIAIVECKAPNIQINQTTFEQVLRYNMAYKVPYVILTNGLIHFCCKLNYASNNYEFLKDIPDFKSFISD
jgi:type I site-specific restriction endonuclease